MCIGTLVFDIERTKAVPIQITVHHGESLRWDGLNGNADLLDPDALMNWLSERGMTFVREEYANARARAALVATEESHWHDAMPESLQPFFEKMRQPGADSHPEWTAAIEREFPNPVHRGTVLLQLFGSGTGPWSGFPLWESVPEKLLLEMPLDQLLEAIGDAPAERVREGAARLFSGWDFGQIRGADRARIPIELRPPPARARRGRSGRRRPTRPCTEGAQVGKCKGHFGARSPVARAPNPTTG
jgi:hypothetical protein